MSNKNNIEQTIAEFNQILEDFESGKIPLEQASGAYKQSIELADAIKSHFEKLKNELPDKEFFYIDGEISGRKREEIKKLMEVTKVDIEYTILNFGEYEVEFKSDFKITLL